MKNHENFKILFWSRESEKTIFTNFPEFFYEEMGWKSGNLERNDLGISSETLYVARRGGPALYVARTS